MRGNATIASVTCPASLKLRSCFGHFTESLQAAGVTAFPLPFASLLVGKARAGSDATAGKQRGRRVVFRGSGSSRPGYPKVAERAAGGRTGPVPRGELPPLSDAVSDVPLPRTPGRPCPQPLPLVHSRAPIVWWYGWPQPCHPSSGT